MSVEQVQTFSLITLLCEFVSILVCEAYLRFLWMEVCIWFRWRTDSQCHFPLKCHVRIESSRLIIPRKARCCSRKTQAVFLTADQRLQVNSTISQFCCYSVIIQVTLRMVLFLKSHQYQQCSVLLPTGQGFLHITAITWTVWGIFLLTISCSVILHLERSVGRGVGYFLVWFWKC